MAVVNNYTLRQTSVTKSPASRLSLMQARFQQRQLEEKEHKLYAMLEEQQDHVMLPPIPYGGNGGRMGTNSVSQQNSASSVTSLTSSSNGSSLASSLGSTGSGNGNAGKVRQMFEDRRGANPPNRNRPAIATYAKTLTRRPSPSKGYDRSYPLDPLPSKTNGYRKRGVSLERPGIYMNTEDLRRSRSQYQVYDEDNIKADRNDNTLQKPINYYARQNKSTTSLAENNRFGFGSNNNFSDYETNDAEELGRYKLNQTYRRAPAGLYEAINGVTRLSEMEKENNQMAEKARQLEAENQRIQAEAKRREQQLMETIRQQQAEMQRLQQLAAQAEQKAKAAMAMNNARTAQSTLRPANKKTAVILSTTDESDDAKSEGTGSSVSVKPYVPPKPNRFKAQSRSTGSASEPAETVAVSRKSSVATAKPDVVPNKPPKTPRQSIFATAARHKDGLEECKICGRSFAPERIEKHQSICEKTASKKRKVFDITKMRVEGTEAETYILHKPGRSTQPAEPVAPQKAPVAPPKPAAENQEEKPAWRRKHENFLETIRAAKAAQRHLDNGGSIADLPPPPPSDTSDYIGCPHCGRRFSPGAADRHIPKCANIKSNKPRQM